MLSAEDDDREYLVDLLPRVSRAKIDQILAYFNPPAVITQVEVRGARVVTERWARIYGLEIELDANGNAATVGFPDGALVIGMEPSS